MNKYKEEPKLSYRYVNDKMNQIVDRDSIVKLKRGRRTYEYDKEISKIINEFEIHI